MEATEEDYRNAELARQRAEKLGYTFNGVPWDAKHEKHLKSKKQESPHLDGEGNHIYQKWSWVKTGSGDLLPVTVLLDSGSEDNFIPLAYAEKLQLERRPATPVTQKLINGQTFTAAECTMVSLNAKKEETSTFYVAPNASPLNCLLVGRNFTRSNPDVFLDRKPEREMYYMAHAKTEKREREAIEARRAVAEAQAQEIARRRRERHNWSATQSASPSAFSSRQVTMRGTGYATKEEK